MRLLSYLADFCRKLGSLTVITAIALIGAPAIAHEMTPSIATIIVTENGKTRLEIKTNLEAFLAEIGPDHADTSTSKNTAVYESFRSMSNAELSTAFQEQSDRFAETLKLRIDNKEISLLVRELRVPEMSNTDLPRQSTIVLDANGSYPSARSLDWHYPHGDSVIRLTQAVDTPPYHSEFVRAGSKVAVRLNGSNRQSAWSVFVDYIPVGFAHIIPLGIDHILFVIGLFLLATGIRPLLWQITAFTIAHSVTLAAAATGMVTISPLIVEPLIAVSIVYIAIENIFRIGTPRIRTGLVFGFGLLHGLGFAGVLSEFGLPHEAFLAGLIGFNVGVEFGQLAVIAACYVFVGYWFANRHWYRPAINIPASLAIGIVAFYWTFERVFL